MPVLLIQHARWQGELVTPDDIRLKVGAKCDCVCIGCSEPLILRRGEKKQWHFAHRAKTFCGGETYVHKVVKAWISEKLIGQTIPLLQHPQLDAPQGFCVAKGWQESRNEKTGRVYDVILEGMFLYKEAKKEKHGHLIFEVYYSNAKDDEFKLQTQREESYILEVNAKKFYEDGRENLTVKRLTENSQWIWFTDQQVEEYKQKREKEKIRQKNWPGYGKKPLREVVGEWISNVNRLHFDDIPPKNRLWGKIFTDCGLLNTQGHKPSGFWVDKVWKNKHSQRTNKIYDIVFKGEFTYNTRSVSDWKNGYLICQLVDEFDTYDDDFKLQIQKAKFCVLEVNIHSFFWDGLSKPTEARLMGNSRWVW